MRRRAPPRRLKVPRLPKGVALTVLLTLLTAWLIPALTRQWQDQQRAQELKAAMVTRVGRDTTDALVLSSFIANGRFEPMRNEKRPFRIPMKVFNDLDLNWERNRREISAQLEAYFADTDILGEWRSYSQLTRDTYFLITERQFNRLWTVTRLQRLLPRRHRCKIESLREPFPMGTRLRTRPSSLAPQSTCKPSELKNPRSNYFFVATALLEAKSSLTEDILRTDPDGLSTDTGDLLHDLLPLV